MTLSEADERFQYLDLCAGIGGFHQAMERLGGKCIGASEIDAACIETYQANWPSVPQLGNINDIDPEVLPKFQVLCAGFPCQPFSKAGKQLGFADESRGQLFYKILGIIDAHKEVEFILLENVRNLADKKDYWDSIQSELEKRDFAVTEDPMILSPSDFGIPQVRERVFILGIRESVIDRTKLPNSFVVEGDLGLRKKTCGPSDALSILDKEVDSSLYVDDERQEMLLAWDDFRENTNIKVLGYPIWVEYFGTKYKSDSAFFRSVALDDMPKWRQNFVRKNRHFYHLHKDYIDEWLAIHKIKSRIKLYQKFEWNCGTDVSSIKGGIIQVRQSGVRVKRPNYFPALVAIANTPIVWDANRERFREISPKEAGRLQSFNEDFQYCGTRNQQYRQLGNAINVEIAYQLGKGLFELRKVNSNGKK